MSLPDPPALSELIGFPAVIMPAFLETFGRIRPVLQRHVDERVLTEAYLPSETRLANMTDPAILGLYGLTAEVGVGGDERTYARTQRWAEALETAGFGGVIYAARHDPALNERSVALFGKPGYQPSQLLARPARYIPEELIDRAAVEYAIEVLPSVPVSGPHYY